LGHTETFQAVTLNKTYRSLYR